MKSLAIISGLLIGISGCTNSTGPTATEKPVFEPLVERDEVVTPSEHRPKDPIETPDQESMSPDEQVTANIRKGMMDSKMSVNLQKIKVNTTDGKVTLTGLVKTLEEKQKAGEIAVQLAGAARVENWIEVE